MNFKDYRFVIVVRVIAIVLNGIVISWLIINTNMYVNVFFFSVILIAQSYSLIKYIDKVNKNFIRFIGTLKNRDLTFQFNEKKLSGSYNKLYSELNNTLLDLKEKDIENQTEKLFLESIIRNIGVGLIAFDSAGTIEYLNMELRRLLGISHIKTIEELDVYDENFSSVLYDAKSGTRTLVDFQKTNENVKLSLIVSEIVIGKKHIKIIMVQNITDELEQKEIETWQQLIRIMSHEIINSVTPIASLASTSKKIIDDNIKKNNGSNGNWETEVVEDLSKAISTIERRSNSLQKFIESYRKLNKIPKPEFKNINISELFDRVYQVVSNNNNFNDNIDFTIDVNPHSLEITADPDLLEHVLINLIYNSIEALQTKLNGKLTLSAYLNRTGSTIISVKDNGIGIDQSIIDSIFTPFFTTKKEGTGLGLSLSKQIINLHGGRIEAISKPNEETEITLKF